jgi:tetratricopeptide (TPR) repeat protein
VQSEEMIKKMQEEDKRLEAEKTKAAQEKDKLQADSISYVGLNSRLQEEKEKLQKDIEEAKKTIGQKDEDLQKAQISLQRLEQRIAKESKDEKNKTGAELKGLKDKVKQLEETLKKERGIFNYNLAVSYTQAKLYDEAIEAYEKSLDYNPQNPDANYNLGLLYANVKNMPDKAVAYYEEYLRLKPDADDKEEVQGWIKQFQAEK